VSPRLATDFEAASSRVNLALPVVPDRVIPVLARRGENSGRKLEHA
jgi:hypothetical protein